MDDGLNASLLGRAVFTALLYLFLFQFFWLLRRDLQRALVGGHATLTVIAAPPEAAEAGFGVGQTFAITQSATLGRAPTNVIVVPAATVSQGHLRLVHRNQAWWVEDLGSTNGTFVNGTAVTGIARLESGDVISCGPDVQLRLDEA